MEIYEAVAVEAKSGDELFTFNKLGLGVKLIDFWRWSQSDLLNNSLRGVLAEFIVAQDLGLSEALRVEWDSFDLITLNGLRIEVKSSAYLQSWKQTKLSAIKFDIRPTLSFCHEINSYTKEIKRQSDFYVFCVLAHKEMASVNPLDLDQWLFYVLPTTLLDKEKPGQKSITLNSLLNLKPIQCRFGEIKDIIQGFST